MRRGRPLGLRTRLLAAMVATAGVTLLAAALALLPTLQDQLRRQAENSLEAATLSTRPSIERALRPPTAAGWSQLTTLQSARPASFEPQNTAYQLAARIDGRVVLFSQDPNEEPGTAASGSSAVYDSPSSIPLPRELMYQAVAKPGGWWADHETLKRNVGDTAVIVTPLHKTVRGVDRTVGFMLTQKRLTDVAATTQTVRRAFLTAAAVGLGIALVLATGLAATLVRRLRRLQQAAVRISSTGSSAPPPPLDEGRDEVGDLARALGAMQAALGRQETARRAFVATASHELRTPLTSIGWSLEMLRDDLEARHLDVADARSQVAGAQAQLGRLQRLAAELLDLSRLDAEVELRSEPVELGELVRAVAAEFESRAREAGVRLEVDHPRGPVWGRGDPDAIARIARILLDNALRFAPAGSLLRVTPAYHGDHATVAVQDTGPGVPQDERERIFERFQRGSSTGGEGGFGLGLAIGRELARRQGGELALDDAPERPGARFILRLPIELPTGTHAAADTGGTAEQPAAAPVETS